MNKVRTKQRTRSSEWIDEPVKQQLKIIKIGKGEARDDPGAFIKMFTLPTTAGTKEAFSRTKVTPRFMFWLERVGGIPRSWYIESSLFCSPSPCLIPPNLEFELRPEHGLKACLFIFLFSVLEQTRDITMEDAWIKLWQITRGNPCN